MMESQSNIGMGLKRKGEIENEKRRTSLGWRRYTLKVYCEFVDWREDIEQITWFSMTVW